MDVSNKQRNVCYVSSLVWREVVLDEGRKLRGKEQGSFVP